MNLSVLSKIKTQKIGKMPVVILPLKMWEEIENKLEDMEITQAYLLREKIAKARLEKKTFSFSQIKKKLKF